MRVPWGIINIVAGLTVLYMSTAAHAAGACCLTKACEAVADEAACGALGGVYLEGADCADAPCGAGACCSDLACFDNIGAFDCVTGGRDFAGAGTLCADDPCAIGVGVCCLDGDCLIVEERACSADGGTWLGPGTTCVLAPCELGACCRPADCADEARFTCSDGAFLPGESCRFEPCEIEDSCPLDSLYRQAPASIEQFNAYVSDASAGLFRYDDFYAVTGAVDTVRWFGLDVSFDGGFTECDDTSNFFRVGFYEDVAGAPGPLVCNYDFQIVEPMPTGLDIEGFQVHEYRLELSEPCVLTHGWLTINGFGDDCLFAWYGSADGNDRSWCEGCSAEIQFDDMTFCLLGAAGGIGGSCCDESTGQCADAVDITACTAVDQRFTPEAACAELDPACAALSGACCFTDGTPCALLGEVACADAGGDWLGDGTLCADCPPAGPCCIGDGSCVVTLEDDCLNEGFLWLGADLTCDDCPEVPECPGDSLVNQPADTPVDFLAGTSEVASPFARFEDFTGVPGAIEAVTFYGFDLEPVGNGFIECVELDNRFEISFHRDAAGAPGEEVCSYELEVERTPLEVLFLGAELNLYEVELPEPCALPNGWVGIRGLGSEICWFLWISSPAGNGRSYCDGCPVGPQGHDQAVCLRGTAGGVTGACCDDVLASCTDAVDIADCTDPTLDFTAATACAELEPACGVIAGACCQPGAVCAQIEESACDAEGGTWLGAETLCNLCPCELPCGEDTFPEGEPVCSDGYVDTYNGGCDVAPEIRRFARMTPCVPICGTTGVYNDGVDFDWYTVTLESDETLTLTVEAEFPVGGAIVAPEAGCEDPFVIEVDTADECAPLEISAAVSAGTYWIVVGPVGGGDLSVCGARYTATVTTSSPCTPNCKDAAACADADGNGVRDDACTWWDCVNGFCHPVDVEYGDVGGGFLGCVPDQVADGHDHYHALDCFADWDGGDGPYPCPMINVDLAGKGTPCVPDGLCDVNDAVAAMDVFADSSLCGCSQGPAPVPPTPGGSAALTLVAPPRVAPGDVVAVDVRVTTTAAVRAYQLAPVVQGGRGGRLELIDMAIAPRDDALLGVTSWRAFNLDRAQLMAGDSVPAARREGYLATFYYRASPDAAGRFVVDLRHGAPRGDSQLLGAAPGELVDIRTVEAARVEIRPPRK